MLSWDLFFDNAANGTDLCNVTGPARPWQIIKPRPLGVENRGSFLDRSKGNDTPTIHVFKFGQDCLIRGVFEPEEVDHVADLEGSFRPLRCRLLFEITLVRHLTIVLIGAFEECVSVGQDQFTGPIWVDRRNSIRPGKRGERTQCTACIQSLTICTGSGKESLSASIRIFDSDTPFFLDLCCYVLFTFLTLLFVSDFFQLNSPIFLVLSPCLHENSFPHFCAAHILIVFCALLESRAFGFPQLLNANQKFASH
jgi:hypothetical protein